jgi:TonB family protein
MTLLAVAISAILAQSPALPPLRPATCAAPPDEAVASLCAGEDGLRQAEQPGAADADRDAARTRAAGAFQRAVDQTRDLAIRKRALQQLERLYDTEHLNLPGEADAVIRQLVAMNPGDLDPLFRLARVQERQGLFDTAESTLLAARQQKPEDAAPYRELAQFFTRRAAALSAEKDREDPAGQPPTVEGKPDKDGIYSIGGSVQAPEKVSSETVVPPPEAVASGISGSVVIEIVVNEDGAVSDARVVRSVRMLDQAALASVRQWRFTPGMLEGHPVPVRMTVVVKF